jgi:hypothetical protein
MFDPGNHSRLEQGTALFQISQNEQAAGGPKGLRPRRMGLRVDKNARDVLRES